MLQHQRIGLHVNVLIVYTPLLRIWMLHTDIVYHYLHGKWMRDAAEAHFTPVQPTSSTQSNLLNTLSLLGYACPNQLVMAALLMSYHTTWMTRYLRFLNNAHQVFTLSRNIQQFILKIHSTAIRRTCRFLDGTLIPKECVAQLPYLELLYGRSDMITDWAQKHKNRCAKTYHLHTVSNGWDPAAWRAKPHASASLCNSWTRLSRTTTNPG